MDRGYVLLWEKSCQWDFYHIIRECVKCANEKKLHALRCLALTQARVWASSPRMPQDAVLALVSFVVQLLAKRNPGKFWVLCRTSVAKAFEILSHRLTRHICSGQLGTGRTPRVDVQKNGAGHLEQSEMARSQVHLFRLVLCD